MEGRRCYAEWARHAQGPGCVKQKRSPCQRHHVPEGPSRSPLRSTGNRESADCRRAAWTVPFNDGGNGWALHELSRARPRRKAHRAVARGSAGGGGGGTSESLHRRGCNGVRAVRSTLHAPACRPLGTKKRGRVGPKTKGHQHHHRRCRGCCCRRSTALSRVPAAACSGGRRRDAGGAYARSQERCHAAYARAFQPAGTALLEM